MYIEIFCGLVCPASPSPAAAVVVAAFRLPLHRCKFGTRRIVLAQSITPLIPIVMRVKFGYI
jgi:hypothetical protein